MISVEECVISEEKSVSEFVGSSEERMLKEAAKLLKVGENKDDY